MCLCAFNFRFVSHTWSAISSTSSEKEKERDRDSLFNQSVMTSMPPHTDQRMEPSPVMQLPVVPLRTLSKGTLDMIAADVKRGSFTPPPGGVSAQTTGEQRGLGESNTTLLRFDSELNQLRPVEKSLSSQMSQTVNAAQLSRNNSIDVPAAVAAAERAAISKQADSSNVVLSEAIMRRNAFITLQANYAAKADELKRSQDEHLELTMAHMEVQRKAEQLAKQVDESEAAVKAAEEQARQADMLWKNVIEREKKQSEMTTMLPMEEVQRAFEQNDGNAAGAPAVYEGDAAFTPTRSMSFKNGQAGSADMSSFFERTRSFQSAVAIDEEIKRIQNRQSFHQGRMPNASNSNMKDKIQRDLNASQSAQDARNKTISGVKRPSSATVPNPVGSSKQPKSGVVQPKSLPTKPVIIHAAPHDASNKPRLECRNCGRVNTPQWRIGPDGPKTLCNACGVHYRKFKTLPLFQIKFNEPPPPPPPKAS